MSGQPTAVWPADLPHDQARLIYQAQPFTVYRQYDADGVLLYVGCTDNLHRRTVGHRSKSPWWPLVARIESELLPNFRSAWLAELRAIKNEAPLYNVIHSLDRPTALARREALA